MVFFKNFSNKNQLPGFYISGNLFENGLILTLSTLKILHDMDMGYSDQVLF